MSRKRRRYERRHWRHDGLLVALDPIEWTMLSHLTGVRMYHRPLTQREANLRESLRVRFVACGVATGYDTYGLGQGYKPAERAR